MAPGKNNSGHGHGDWKSKGDRGGKASRYQRQQSRGSGGKGAKKTYTEGSQAARLNSGGRKETILKAAQREQGDELDKRFGYVPIS